MMPTLSDATLSEVGSHGLDIVAAGAPLEAIVGHALTSYQGHEARSMEGVRSACTLLSTSKGFQQAVLGFEGAVAVDFSPATTEAAAGFAGGHLPSAGRFLLLLERARTRFCNLHLTPLRRSCSEQHDTASGCSATSCTPYC
jgi:hypothetical protein